MKGLRSVNTEGAIKLFLSLSLLAYAIIVSIVSKNILVAVAMLCSTFGDIAIMSNRGVFNETKYPNWDYGIVFFALAHIMYMLAMKGTHTSAIAFVAFFAFLVILFMVFNLKEKENTITNVAYAVCILCNLTNCFMNKDALAVIGMLFFISSDIILILTEKKEVFWQKPIWATYVIAQILMITANI